MKLLTTSRGTCAVAHTMRSMSVRYCAMPLLDDSREANAGQQWDEGPARRWPKERSDFGQRSSHAEVANASLQSLWQFGRSEAKPVSEVSMAVL